MEFVSNNYYQSITIAIVRGDIQRQQNVFSAWKEYKQYMKRVSMKIDINYKPLAMKKRFFLKWTKWIPQHRKFLLRLHKFECLSRKNHEISIFLFNAGCISISTETETIYDAI